MKDIYLLPGVSRMISGEPAKATVGTLQIRTHRGKPYWAPANKMAAGGDTAIILDAADGTLLHIYRGK